jgi:hypothetical protein
MQRSRHLILSLPIALLSLSATATAEPVRTPVGMDAAVQSRDQPGDLPPDGRLLEMIREVYRRYEATVAQSDHHLRFRLRDFRTIERPDFGRHDFLEVAPPDEGMRLALTRQTYEAPWVRVGQIVYYDLRWRPASESERRVAEQKRTILAGTSLRGALDLEQALWSGRDEPLAITSYVVEVDFAGRVRTYRTTASWNRLPEDDRFRMSLNDEVVADLESLLVETALPLPKDEFESAQKAPVSREKSEEREAGHARRTTAAAVLGCEEDVEELLNITLELSDQQGHRRGQHRAQLRMAADCRVQCAPEAQ